MNIRLLVGSEDILHDVPVDLVEFDGIIVASLVYYARSAGQLCSFLDRLFYVGGSKMEGKQLLTQNQRRLILRRCESNRKELIKWLILFFIFSFLLGLMFWYIISKSTACIIWFGMFLFICGVYGSNYRLRQKLRNTNKEIWVQNAIFLSSNKYGHCCFEVMRGGKKERVFRRAYPKDVIVPGDRVILLSGTMGCSMFKAFH